MSGHHQRPSAERRSVSHGHSPLSRIDLGFLDDDARGEMELFVALVELSDDFIAMAHLDGRVMYVNAAGRRLVGLEPHADVSAHRIDDYLGETALKQSLEVEQPAVRERGRWQGESTLRHFVTAQLIDVSIDSYLVTHPVTRAPLAMATVQRDIRAMKAADAALRATTARFRRILAARETIAELAQGAITKSASELIPAAVRELQTLLGGCDVVVVRHPHDAPDTPTRRLVEAAVAAKGATFGSQLGMGNTFALAVPARVSDEPAVTVVVRAPVPRELDADEQQWVELIAVVIAGVLQRDTVETRLRYEALHDALTALPNRTLLLDRLRHALERARRSGTSMAVMLLDLDNFKWINDSFGHLAGDAALTAFAANLQETARANDTVGRFGGDEFLVIMEDVARDSDVVQIAERMRATWSEPIRIADRMLYLSASAGIAITRGERVPDAPQLLREADQAMYRAKRRQAGLFEIFSPATEASPDRLRLIADLRDALAHDGLSLVYQPIVSARDGTVGALEALCRWQHAELGEIAPSTFVPIAEESGLIVPLGQWVLRRACASAARWRAEGLRVPVEINVSPREFTRPEFAQGITDALREAGVAPAGLGLEIGEAALLADVAAAHRTLARLHALGVRVSLDAVGTSTSSLSSLRSFGGEIDGIKIDRQFVSTITSDDDEAAVVAAAARIGGALGMSVVAEGVETAVQRERVRALGCDFVQGWHTGVPVTEDEVRVLFTGAGWNQKGTNGHRAQSEP